MPHRLTSMHPAMHIRIYMMAVSFILVPILSYKFWSIRYVYFECIYTFRTLFHITYMYICIYIHIIDDILLLKEDSQL